MRGQGTGHYHINRLSIVVWICHSFWQQVAIIAAIRLVSLYIE
jgi:hypothetical protein